MKHRTLWVGFVVAAGLACSGAGVSSPPEVVAAPDVDTAVATVVRPALAGADPVATHDGSHDLPLPVGEEDPTPAPVASADPAPAPAPGLPVATPDEPPPPPPDEDEDKDQKASPKPPAPAPPGITQVSAQSWTVTQALVDRWQDDPYRLGNVREEGEGWAVMNVRQRNGYHLGMRNKDVLLEVNGHKLNTRANLVLTYLACKNDREFDLVFLRNGKRMTHHYAIQK